MMMLTFVSDHVSARVSVPRGVFIPSSENYTPHFHAFVWFDLLPWGLYGLWLGVDNKIACGI